jgi:hypothetical protein
MAPVSEACVVLQQQMRCPHVLNHAITNHLVVRPSN